MNSRLLSGIALWGFTGAFGCAATYYVAPHGSDNAKGTIDAPFATVRRAQESAAAGDTVFFRGGTYELTDSHITYKVGPYDCVTRLDKSGTRSNPIRYWAYPGERPVFDMSRVKPPGGG